MAKVMALSVNVYEHKCALFPDNDCTNGGISSRHKTLYLLCEDQEKAQKEHWNWNEVDETDERLIKIVRSSPCGRPYVHAEPVNDPNKREIGYMFGGNFIYTSDGRFPETYPIPLHDRSETLEEYDILSR